MNVRDVLPQSPTSVWEALCICFGSNLNVQLTLFNICCLFDNAITLYFLPKREESELYNHIYHDERFFTMMNMPLNKGIKGESVRVLFFFSQSYIALKIDVGCCWTVNK